jgi:hypothetical protein
MALELAAKGGHPARTVQLNIAFSLHTFTRSIEATDDAADHYRDNREVRTFCRERYRLSFQLPTIARELNTRRCQFETGQSGQLNFVTIDLGQGVRYAVFFDLMRWKKAGPDAILLMVQTQRPRERKAQRPRGLENQRPKLSPRPARRENSCPRN